MNLLETAEALTPNQVNYDIRVVFPDGRPATFCAIDVPLERAIDVLEALADELRAALPSEPSA